LTSIYTVSREDIYDYRRCPKIVAIKAYKALRGVRHQPSQPRAIEPVTIGMIGEAAVRLGFQGIPRAAAMEKIVRAIPQANVSEYLKEIALESLRGVEEIRAQLADHYGQLTIVGRGEGRHPDLAGRVRPDFVAYSERDSEPIIVESKDSTNPSPTDKFQAMFYNGIAERYGVYLLEERLEGEQAVFRPRLVKGKAKTLLVYPRLAKHSVVTEKFAPGGLLIKAIWKAKELGFKGLVPETECGSKCPHNRLKLKLSEGDMEPLPPLPLIFSEGILESDFSLDIGYQAGYAWNLLPQEVKLAILFSSQRGVGGLIELKDWLTKSVGVDEEAAEIVLNPDKREKFLASRPDAQRLGKSMESDLEPWKIILKKRLEAGAPSVLAIATAVYSLPKRSLRFVKDAWDRWR
jgi:hypothetical protein